MNKTILNITEKDYIDSQWLHYNLGLLKFTGITLFAIFFAYLLHEAVKLSIPASIGGMIGFWLWYMLYYLVYLKFKVKKLYKQQKMLHTPTEITWNNESISFFHKNCNAEIKWDDYAKYKENEKLFLMYQSDVIFNIVPKSSFSSLELLNDFKSHVTTIKS